MPSQSTRAAMAVAAFRGGSVAQVQFFYNSTTGSDPLNNGTFHVGDVVICAFVGGPVGYMASWPLTSDNKCAYKVLDAADVVADWGQAYYATICVYRPRLPAHSVETDGPYAAVAGTVNVPGVSSAGSKGIIHVFNGGSFSVPGVKPASMASRRSEGASDWSNHIADDITGRYQGSATLWTTAGASGKVNRFKIR